MDSIREEFLNRGFTTGYYTLHTYAIKDMNIYTFGNINHLDSFKKTLDSFKKTLNPNDSIISIDTPRKLTAGT